MADAAPKPKGGGLLQGNRKFLVLGALAAGGVWLYLRKKSSSSTSSTAGSVTCQCDDGSTPNANGICADGTTCGAAGSYSSTGGGDTGVNSTGSPTTQGSPCITSSGAPGVVDFTGNCVSTPTPATPPKTGTGPTKSPTSCPKGQRLVDGKCTTSCPPGYERKTPDSVCTKKKTTLKKVAKNCPPGYYRPTPESECKKQEKQSRATRAANPTNTSRLETPGSLQKPTPVGEG